MSDRDLPLFTWEPPKQVLLFPLTRRIGKVRHTARHLVRKQGDDAQLYWKQVLAANRKHLARFGLSEEDVDRELHAFFDAVQSEMIRITYTGRNSGGAA